LTVVDGRLAVTPVGAQGSHLIGDLAESDALVVVPESVTWVEAGETVTVLPLDEDF
jgi:molybdopterin molybdotransferase